MYSPERILARNRFRILEYTLYSRAVSARNMIGGLTLEFSGSTRDERRHAACGVAGQNHD